MPLLTPAEEVLVVDGGLSPQSFIKKNPLPLPPSLEEEDDDESPPSSSAKKRALRSVRVDFGDILDGDDRRMSKADATPMPLMPTMDLASC